MAHEISGRYFKSSTLKQDDTDWAAEVMAETLYTSEDEIIKSVTFGNLARDRRKDTRLQMILDHLRFQAQFMPTIYHQRLVDEDGESPSCNHILTALDTARNYIFGTDHEEANEMGKKYNCVVDDDLANEVDRTRDNIDIALSGLSFRKFLWTERVVDKKATQNAQKKLKLDTLASSRKRQGHIFTDIKGSQGAKVKHQKLSDARAKHAIWFCDELEKRMNDIPSSDRDKLLSRPLVDVGYSERSIERLKKHAEHESSSYLMNMFEAIFEVMHDKNNNSPEVFLEQHIIYLISDVEQAEISEIGWTKLAEGYTSNADGFSHYPAGQSNYSAQKVTAQEWSYAREVLMNASPYKDKLKVHERIIAEMEAKTENYLASVRKKLEKRAEKAQERQRRKVQEFLDQTLWIRKDDPKLSKEMEDIRQEIIDMEAKIRKNIGKKVQEQIAYLDAWIEETDKTRPLLRCIDDMARIVERMKAIKDDEEPDQGLDGFTTDLSNALPESASGAYDDDDA